MPQKKTIQEFLTLLAGSPDLLARYNDPQKRDALLQEFLSPADQQLLGDPDVIGLTYTLEIEAEIQGRRISGKGTKKVPIFPPPIF